MDNMKKPKVPSKEEFDKMTPEQQVAREKEVMMKNLNLSPEEKKAKKAMQNKPLSPAMKKMVKGVKKQEADREDRTAAMYQKLDAEKKYKAGGKVRGCGMARGGRVCKMVKMKGA